MKGMSIDVRRVSKEYTEVEVLANGSTITVILDDSQRVEMAIKFTEAATILMQSLTIESGE